MRRVCASWALSFTCLSSCRRGQLHGTVVTTVGVQRVRMGGIDGATLYILVKCKLKGKKNIHGLETCMRLEPRPPSYLSSCRWGGYVAQWWLGVWTCLDGGDGKCCWCLVGVEIVTWHMIWSLRSLPNVYELLVSTWTQCKRLQVLYCSLLVVAIVLLL